MRIMKFGLAAIAALALALTALLYLAPETATRLLIDTGRQMSGLVRKEIDLPGGLHYVYLEGGTGEPLMLLHGFGANKDNFARAARFLTPHYRVIIPDHIGFGESSHPAEADYSPTAQAERLRALARALGVNALHLGGSSMGGQIAMTYAALHPTEVGSLWLLDPAGVWSAPKSELANIIEKTGRNPLIARTEEEFAQTFAFVMNNPPVIPRPIINVLAQERLRNVALSERIVQQLIADSVEQRVKGLNTPALIVWGDKDRALSVASAEILHQLLPRSQVSIMQNIGHLPMLEAPQQSAEDYLRFRATR